MLSCKVGWYCRLGHKPAHDHCQAPCLGRAGGYALHLGQAAGLALCLSRAVG